MSDTEPKNDETGAGGEPGRRGQVRSEASCDSHDKSRTSQDSVAGTDPHVSDLEDFGSTVSLASSTYSASNSASLQASSFNKSAERLCRLDPHIYRKHRDLNISLRSNLTDKLLKPVIATGIRKMDKLSQNISNHQILVQDVLFQSRVSTSNLLKLQKLLEKFSDENHLKEIKIDDNTNIQTPVEMDIEGNAESSTSTMPL